MTRDEAVAILQLPIDEAVDRILALAEKAEKYDQLCGEVSPTTPSGMIPPYLKEPAKNKRKRRPGRKKGHEGSSRIGPEHVDHFKEHSLERCPDCQTPLKESIKKYKRYTEDMPRIEKPEVTEHTVNGYWCPQCSPFKVVLLFRSLCKNFSSRNMRCIFTAFTFWSWFFRASGMFAKG